MQFSYRISSIRMRLSGTAIGGVKTVLLAPQDIIARNWILRNI